MNDILNPDQIAALFEAAKAGDVPETLASCAASAAADAVGRLLAADEVHGRPSAPDHARRSTASASARLDA